MTEINTNVQAGQQTRQQQQAQRPAGSRRDQPTRASANRLPGLASGLNTQGTIETIVQVERRRLEPVQDQRADTLRELESFGLINTSLEKINTTIGTLKGAAVWEGKIVESSDEGIVTATATRGAKPGKHTLVVDRLALNHQIASQGYANQDDQVGTGRLVFTVGDGSPNIIVIDESNNTLTGVKDAINFATDQVNATVVKTGNKLKPYQLVLTSQKTGSEGRIEIEVNLQGGEPPNFKPSVEDPSPWRGVGKPTAAGKIEPITGTGASTSIVRVVGEYTGEDDNSFTFTAVQTGVVGNCRCAGPTRPAAAGCSTWISSTTPPASRSSSWTGWPSSSARARSSSTTSSPSTPGRNAPTWRGGWPPRRARRPPRCPPPGGGS
jgi:hypothetical protein